MDLHVDRKLKPSYLMIRKNSWVYSDVEQENHRLSSIMQYLMTTKSTVRQGNADVSPQVERYSETRIKRDRFTSLSNLENLLVPKKVTRSKSLDNIMPSADSPVSDTDLNSTGIHSQQRSSECLESSAMSQIMESLDFQINQKNERSHFIVSELLIQTIEFLFSDELLRRSGINLCGPMKPSIMRPFNKPHSIMFNTNAFHPGLSTHSEKPRNQSSKADTVAVLIVDDVMRICVSLGIEDKFRQVFPSSLQLLQQQLEQQRESTSSNRRIRPLNVLDKQDNQIENQSETATANLIRTVVEAQSLPLNIPVGEYPMMQRDQCLPTYIITRMHDYVSNTNTLRIQSNKCPGCSISFSHEKARRLRLCHYYGFYFCSVCHNNTLMLIPARILTSWDFSMHPVSCLARDLLNVIHSEPLFSPTHFSDRLRSTLRVLNAVIRLRLQGRLLLTFIESCRQGRDLIKKSLRFPSHWLSDICPMFSIADLQLVESGTMEQRLKSFAKECVEHISICPLCQAHGYLCELCDNKTDVIFPFELDKVHQCIRCFGCSHIRCHLQFKDQPCPRCERRKTRKKFEENPFQ